MVPLYAGLQLCSLPASVSSLQPSLHHPADFNLLNDHDDDDDDEDDYDDDVKDHHVRDLDHDYDDDDYEDDHDKSL